MVWKEIKYTVEPPLTVTSDERSPPINGHFHSPRGVFLYILPLINGHLPPPVSGHNNLYFWAKIPPLNGQIDSESENGRHRNRK